MKRSFDIAVIIPLEEEFNHVIENFTFVEDLSSDELIRFMVRPREADYDLLLVR